MADTPSEGMIGMWRGDWENLKDIPRDVLQYELRRRDRMQQLGLCEYCERSGRSSPCKKPKLHEAATVRAEYAAMLLKLGIKGASNG